MKIDNEEQLMQWVKEKLRTGAFDKELAQYYAIHRRSSSYRKRIGPIDGFKVPYSTRGE